MAQESAGLSLLPQDHISQTVGNVNHRVLGIQQHLRHFGGELEGNGAQHCGLAGRGEEITVFSIRKLVLAKQSALTVSSI